jgi:hypothetical protein
LEKNTPPPDASATLGGFQHGNLLTIPAKAGIQSFSLLASGLGSDELTGRSVGEERLSTQDLSAILHGLQDDTGYDGWRPSWTPRDEALEKNIEITIHLRESPAVLKDSRIGLNLTALPKNMLA